MTPSTKPRMPWRKIAYYEWVPENASQYQPTAEKFVGFCGQENASAVGRFIPEAEARALWKVWKDHDNKCCTVHTYCRCEDCGETVRASKHKCKADIDRLAMFEEGVRVLLAYWGDMHLSPPVKRAAGLLRAALEGK